MENDEWKTEYRSKTNGVWTSFFTQMYKPKIVILAGKAYLKIILLV